MKKLGILFLSLMPRSTNPYPLSYSCSAGLNLRYRNNGKPRKNLSNRVRILFLSLLIIGIPSLLAEKEEISNPKAKPSRSTVRRLVGGVKQVAYEGPKDLAKETVGEVPRKPPIVSVVEGVNRGTEKLIDHTIKGAYKVATLGRSELESYEVEEPEKGSGEPTKFKISLPGT